MEPLLVKEVEGELAVDITLNNRGEAWTDSPSIRIAVRIALVHVLNVRECIVARILLLQSQAGIPWEAGAMLR